MLSLPDGNALAYLSPLEDPGSRPQRALFDAETGAWLAPTQTPIDDPIDAPMDWLHGLWLSDGRVLTFIGSGSTYLFDPATGSWDPGPTLPFDGGSSAVLDDGSVLVLSGDGRTARLPEGGEAWLRSGTAPPVGSGPLLIAVPGGAVALGGTSREEDAIPFEPDPRTAVYRSDMQEWSAGPDVPRGGSADGPPGPGRSPAAVVLADGRLLVAGGWGGGTDYACTDGAAILSVDFQAWQSIEPMPACMGLDPEAQLLADGTVVIVGEGEIGAGSGLMTLWYLP
jgi:hypothetical protein